MWTRSIAIGSKEFVDKVKTKLGILAKGRKATETGAGYQLMEPANFYIHHFDAQKGEIESENTCFWNIND